MGICRQPGDVVPRTTSLPRSSDAAKIGVSSADRSKVPSTTGTRQAHCAALARWVFERGCEKNISEHKCGSRQDASHAPKQGLKKGQRRFRKKARIVFHASPLLLEPFPQQRPLSGGVGDIGSMISSGPSCPRLIFVRSRRSAGSVLPTFLTSPSRLGRRQEVLHYPDLTFDHARSESDVVTVRMKRNAAHRIHPQP